MTGRDKRTGLDAASDSNGLSEPAETVAMAFAIAFSATILFGSDVLLMGVEVAFFISSLMADVVGILLGVIALITLAFALNGLNSKRRYPVLAFGDRYYSDMEETEVEMCINCNRSGEGVKTVSKHVFVAFGLPLILKDVVETEECMACHEADPIDYALRSENAPSVVDVLHDDLGEEPDSGTGTVEESGSESAAVGFEHIPDGVSVGVDDAQIARPDSSDGGGLE